MPRNSDQAGKQKPHGELLVAADETAVSLKSQAVPDGRYHFGGAGLRPRNTG